MGLFKNKHKRKVFLAIICIASLFTVSAYAKTDKNDIYTIGKYHIDTFSSYVGVTEFDFGKMLFGANGTDFIQMITNMSFSFDKIIWEVFDFVINKLYKGAEMDGLIHTFFQFSENIFDKIFNVVGLGLTGLYILYIFYLKVFKSGHRAKRALFQLICVVSFSLIWFGNISFSDEEGKEEITTEETTAVVTSQGEKLTKNLNTWSTSIEGFIFEATNGIDDLSVATTSEDAIKQIREMYFQKAVVDPYLLLNYGTTNIDELIKASIKPTEFLKESANKDSLDKISKDVDEAAKAEDEKSDTYRAFIQPTKAMYKLVVGFMSPGINLTIGIPILMIGLVRFLFQLGVLMMLIAFPFMLIISFVPGMDYMLFKGIKTFLGFMFQKSIYSVLILVAFLVFNIIDDLIPMNTIAGFTGNMFVRGIVSFTVGIKRKAILAKLGLGQADHTLSTAKAKSKAVTREIRTTTRRGKELTQQAILKGAALSGKIHPGLMAAAQMYQRTKQQGASPVKNQNVKVSELTNGRNPQMPYERMKLPTDNKQPNGLPAAIMTPPRKTAESLNGKVTAVISGAFPLAAGSLPIDRLIAGKTNQKLSLVQPAMKHVGKSLPISTSRNTPQLTANESLTQQITQLKKSRALVNNRNTIHPINKIGNERMEKAIGNPKERTIINPSSSGSVEQKESGQTIEAQLGRDFVLPKGRSPQQS